MKRKIDDKMMMYQTEMLRKGVTQWKNEALEEHRTRSKRPRAEQNGKRKNGLNRMFKPFFLWQGQKDLNPRHAVLETAALPTELYPCMVGLHGLEPWPDRL